MCLHSEKDKEVGGEDRQDAKPDEEEDKTEGSTSHTESKTHREETAKVKHSPREEDKEKGERKTRLPEREEDNRSSEIKAELEKDDIGRRDDVTEKATNSNSDEVDRRKLEVILHKHPLVLH